MTSLDDFQMPESLSGETAIPASQSHIPGDRVQGDKYSGDKVEGDKITVNIQVSINQIIAGTQPINIDKTNGFKNFLTTYLGTDDEPVPFGGRDQQLEQLNYWLYHGDTQHLLLTAPSGRGKSTLLVRWSQQLTAAPNLGVIFIPISQQFNTNQSMSTFKLLTTRLAHLHNKTISNDYTNSPLFWQDLAANYLWEPLPDGRQLLVILDGLDEAAWNVAADLLPLNLPATTRVVASARDLGGEEQGPAPWLRRLGWDSLPGFAKTMELDNLTLNGVRDVLQKMDYPLDELGPNVDIVTELHRLTEGDPLLLMLYVKDLWEKREKTIHLKPEDLRSIKPGYKKYFDKWWDEQKKLWGVERPLQEQLVRAIKYLLTMARGRLFVEDIQALLPEAMMADSILIREAVASLARFVIGDGQKQGYIFSHPKLAEYFRDLLTQQDKQLWQGYFLAWGKQIVTDLQTERLRPEDTPRYLFRNYIGHLSGSGNEALIWHTLTMPQWLNAQIHYDPTLRQLSQDIELAIACCEKSEVESLPKIVAYSLLQGNIGSRVSKIPPETVGTMASLVNYEQALDYAGLGDSIWYQAAAYISISENLINQGDLSQGVDLLARAQTIAENGDQIELLCRVSELLQKVGKKRRASAILQKGLKLLDADIIHGEALIRVAITAVELDEPEAISQIVDLAKKYIGQGFVSRNRLKSRIALVLGKAKKRDELIRLQEGNHPGGIGTEAFAWIAYGLYLAGDVKASERLFEKVKDDLGKSKRGELIHHRIESPKDVETALVAREIQTDGNINALNVLIKAKAVSIRNEEYSCIDEHMFDEVVRNLIDNNRLDVLLALGEEPTLFDYHVGLFCRYASECNKLGDVDNSLTAQTRAIEALDKFVEKYPPDWTYIRKAFQKVVTMLSQSGSYSSLEKLLPITEKIDGDYGRAQAITILADALHTCGIKERAKALIESIIQAKLRNPVHQTETKAWACLAEAVAFAENDEVVTKELSQTTIKASEAIGNCNYFVEEMGVVAQSLMKIRDVSGLTDLLSVTQQHPKGDFSRGSIIARIAQAMADVGDDVGLQNSISAASKIGYKKASFETLIKIAYILYDKNHIQGLLNIVTAVKNIEENHFNPNFTQVMTTIGLLLIRMEEYEKANYVLSFVPWDEILSPTWSSYRDRYKSTIHILMLVHASAGQIAEVLNLFEFMEGMDFDLIDKHGFDIDIDEIPRSDTWFVTTKLQTISSDLALITAMIVWVGRYKENGEKEEAILKATEVISGLHNPKNRFLGFIALANSLQKGSEKLVSKVISYAMREIEMFRNEGEAEIICANTLIQFGELALALPILEKHKGQVVKDKDNIIESKLEIREALQRIREGQILKNDKIDLDLWLVVLKNLILMNEIRYFFKLFSETIIANKSMFYTKSDSSLYVNQIYDFARSIFEVSPEDSYHVKELLSSAFEATNEIEANFEKALAFARQSILHFQLNEIDQHENTARLALEAFRHGYLGNEYGQQQRKIVEMIVLILAENTNSFPKDYLINMVLAGFKFARNRGRSEVLEHIAIFSPILGSWKIAARTWERIKAIEALV